MSFNLFTKPRKRSIEPLNQRSSNFSNSATKKKRTNSNSISKSNFNSDKKISNFKVLSPDQNSKKEAKNILNSWIRNEKEAFKIKEKYIKNENTFFNNKKKSFEFPMPGKQSTNTSYFDTTPSNMNKSAREIQEKTVNLSYNTSFDIKETKMELINKVYSLRNNMKNINTKMLNSSTKKNNQFDEINKLKNRRKDLEKQTQKLEKDMQKLTYKIKNNDKNDYELKNNEHLNNVVNNLKKEHEKTKIMFQTFRTEKFSEKINILLKKWRVINFKKFIEIMDNLKNFHENKISQMNLKLSFKLKKNCFILWKEIFYEEKSENQRKQKLKEDLRDQYLYKKAEKFSNSYLTRKYFKFWLISIKKEKESLSNFPKKSKITPLYNNKTEIKSKINTFLNEISQPKQKYVSPIRDQRLKSPLSSISASKRKTPSTIKKPIIEKKDQKELFEQSFGCNDTNKKNSSQSFCNLVDKENERSISFNKNEEKNNFGTKSDNSIHNKSENLKLCDEYNELELQIDENNDSQIDQIITIIPKPICVDRIYCDENKFNGFENENKNEEIKNNNNNVLKIKNIINNGLNLKEIEERAKKRKENLGIIKNKRHAEIQKKKIIEKKTQEEKIIESEKQKALEYKKNILKKKQEEQKKKEDKEFSKEKSIQNNIKASEKRIQLLKKYYGLIPWKKLIIKRINREKEANKFHIKKLKKYLFELLNEATTLEKIDKNIQISKQLEKARLFYESNMKIKCFNGLLKFYISSFEEQQKIFKQRDDFLTRICFFKWHEVLPKLREKKLVVDKKYDDIVEKFRFVILAERAFRSWKIFIQEEKKEKIKKNQKEVMWKKANNWLSEYSEQKKNLKHK